MRKLPFTVVYRCNSCESITNEKSMNCPECGALWIIKDEDDLI